MIKKFTIALFILGLIYVLVPGPRYIDHFSALPDSVKSDEPGDTIQNPNIAGYYSDFRRAGITKFYQDDFASKFLFGRLIPPVSLNYPPRDAYVKVRDQLHATFLEEYTYFLKGSIFVGGYESYVENNMLKRPHTFIGDHIHISQSDRYFNSKTTIRFYPAHWYFSLPIYIGIWLAGVYMYRLYSRILKDEE